MTIAVSFQVMAWVAERIRIGAFTVALITTVKTSAATMTSWLTDLGGLVTTSTMERAMALPAQTATRPMSGRSR
ncbi:hypothetical protein Pen02_39590 [Plantactinospora endophytica]|uniref:Uncharacterized protein n=1 Tax=Plantactinospora endophytica TaxID=673535 RepID=A0ABQ4E2T1_9ACTN|nr:hypothetical protein Pen02_39590 [Plantactinospora endophytica]